MFLLMYYFKGGVGENQDDIPPPTPKAPQEWLSPYREGPVQ